MHPKGKQMSVGKPLAAGHWANSQGLVSVLFCHGACVSWT
uniref:Uncharacterized protein n=1 Tax=Anguilla anguilla TaxID=7936 RepID=A0A0E9V3G1_ANGAN